MLKGRKYASKLWGETLHHENKLEDFFYPMKKLGLQDCKKLQICFSDTSE